MHTHSSRIGYKPVWLLLVAAQFLNVTGWVPALGSQTHLDWGQVPLVFEQNLGQAGDECDS